MKKIISVIIFFLIAALVVMVFVFRHITEEKNVDVDSESLKIVVTNHFSYDDKKISEEIIMNTIFSATLEIYPTIDCEDPVLFYLKKGKWIKTKRPVILEDD